MTPSIRLSLTHIFLLILYLPLPVNRYFEVRWEQISLTLTAVCFRATFKSPISCPTRILKAMDLITTRFEVLTYSHLTTLPPNRNQTLNYSLPRQ
jgi:hypothetical protein